MPPVNLEELKRLADSGRESNRPNRPAAYWLGEWPSKHADPVPLHKRPDRR
jgi:hypothetical protein